MGGCDAIINAGAGVTPVGAVLAGAVERLPLSLFLSALGLFCPVAPPPLCAAGWPVCAIAILTAPPVAGCVPGVVPGVVAVFAATALAVVVAVALPGAVWAGGNAVVLPAALPLAEGWPGKAGLDADCAAALAAMAPASAAIWAVASGCGCAAGAALDASPLDDAPLDDVSVVDLAAARVGVGVMGAICAGAVFASASAERAGEGLLAVSGAGLAWAG